MIVRYSLLNVAKRFRREKQIGTWDEYVPFGMRRDINGDSNVALPEYLIDETCYFVGRITTSSECATTNIFQVSLNTQDTFKNMLKVI